MTEVTWPLQPHNSVSLSSNGAIVVACSGIQTIESIWSLRNQLTEKAVVLRKQNHKVLILVDLARVPEYTLGTSKPARDTLTNLDFDSLAVIGINQTNLPTAQEFVKEAGLQRKIHFFDTSLQASQWLAGDIVQQTSSASSLAHPIWPARRRKRTI